MLKYLKRQTSRRRTSHDSDDAGRDVDIVDNAQKRHSLRSTTSFCDEVFLEENSQAEEAEACSDAVSCGTGSLSNGIVGADEEIFKYHSRLSMSLTSIVHEPNCLSYFVQYLETKKALPLIKFYLDIENFKRAALTQIEKERRHDELTLQAMDATNSSDKTDERDQKQVDSISLLVEAQTAEADLVEAEEESNDVPELKTLCDLSMRKPLTDDEKSQIYAETNKQLIKNTNNNNNNSNNSYNTTNRLKAGSELSLCSGMSDSVSGLSNISAVSIRDAIAIYQKYLIVNAAQIVKLPIAILAHISLLLCKRHDESEHDIDIRPIIPASCFDEARDYVLQQLERDYVQEFLQSSYYCKYCVELIEGGDETPLHIYDVLYSEATLFYFMEYLEQQHERACLDFWSTAINFRKSFDASDAPVVEAEAQADAMIIYDRFFSLQADFRLWMSNKLRSHVEQRICATGQVAYAFDLPLQVTAKYLEQKHFADFLKSQLFDNYLNELKTKIGNAQAEACTQTTNAAQTTAHKLSLRRRCSMKKTPALASQQHRKTMSDCTHISQHNTLLAAMDVAKPAANMNIDARQLTNPNLLWQRTFAPDPTAAGGGLKFGRVNALGRYERDFDAVDSVSASGNKHNWTLGMSGSKIKNAMRKLVNLPEDKAQEEIAWQVAEMIVKDVTSVTLQGSSQTQAI